MKGPKPVCTFATNKTNQSNPRKLRRLGLRGGMRSVGFLAGPPEGDASSSARACGGGLRTGLPAARRDGLANRAGSPDNDFMETAAALSC
jgi:hypothetical protein